MKKQKDFCWQTEQFDDIKILRYQVPAFERLTPRERILVYYLSRAACAGRDILWQQNNRYNLKLRRVLERVLAAFSGERDDAAFREFVVLCQEGIFCQRDSSPLFHG